MAKNANENDFFSRNAKAVASDLLGKYICSKDGKKFRIVATEAYYYDETDENGKKICYGADKTKEEARKKSRVVAALFDRPGTWCIYGGQLLLSVTNDQISDNVLIKAVETENGESLGPDKMAQALHLYKRKPGYCNCHGQYSLDAGSNLYVIDGKAPSKISAVPRINIKSKKELRFVIVSE